MIYKFLYYVQHGGNNTTVFWKKYNELCNEHGVKPRAVAKELEISSATITKWVNDGMPNLEMISKIAQYFDVPIISEASRKRSVFKSMTSLSQRWVSLRRGSEVSLETQLKILAYTNCTVQFLNNDRYINYEPTDNSAGNSDSDTIFDILDILDRCADTDSYRTVQVQLSRIALFHLKEKGFDREKLRTEHISQKKLDYLYTGVENRDKSQNYGLNFSDISFLREFTGVNFAEMFCN